MVIDIFENFRAKSDGESLRTHIKKALDQVVQLSEAVETVLPSVDFHLLKNESERIEFFKALSKAVIFHDFGKIDYKFQKKMFTDGDFEKIKNFLEPIKNAQFTRHEVLSAIWASLLLEDNLWDQKIITAILFHHYNNYYEVLKEFPEFIYENEEKIEEYFKAISENEYFKSSFNALLNYLVEVSFKDFVIEAIKELRSASWDNIKKAVESLKKGYEDDELSGFTSFYKVPYRLGQDKNSYDEEMLKFLLLLGSLRRADYGASGNVKIEKKLDQVPNFEKAAVTIQKILQEKGENITFWQKDILKNNSSDKLKKTILIAPTGSGKTEFSILWSSKFRKKFLYTLPLRVALNDLYLRFIGEKGYFAKEAGFPEDIADLLHSTSFIEYLREERGFYADDIESKISSAELLSSPVLLTTPDQIFLTSLNYYGSDKVISVYPIANIVVDEIQTYNPEMAAIIIRTLQLVKAYGGNILIMTATFPPYFKKFFAEFNEIDVSKFEHLEVKNLRLKRHRIETVKEQMFEYKEKKNGSKGFEIEINANALEKIKKWIKEKSTLIVVNNVKKAIRLYEALKTEEPVFLLHSRIVEKYKNERIKAIKNKLENKEKVTVIATQVIEASVDFDFDSMITEISTIDSQIQRWGRVYRQRDKDYENKKPNILIFVGSDEEKFDRGTTSIYDKDVIKATRRILLEKQGQLLDYFKEKEMVEKAFDIEINGRKLKEKYEEEIEKNIDFLNYFSASKKSDAQRIFRRLSGINVVVPELMKEDKEGWVEKFAQIVKEGNSKLSWEEISRQVEANEQKNKWHFKQKLYEYSVNFPVFYMNKYYFSKEFKGFWIFESKETEKLKELGLDGVLQDIEDIEIEDVFI